MGQKLAHRLMFELTRGPIGPRLFVLHSCDTRACVNPDHLHLGTAADNAREAGERQRMPRGSTHHNAILDEWIVGQIRQMRRDGWLWREIARNFKIRPGLALRVGLGRRWGWLS